MKTDYPWIEIYNWCALQKEPFSAYKLENVFELTRNVAKPWLISAEVFMKIPTPGNRTYFLLKPGVEAEDFVESVTRPSPTLRSNRTKSIGVVETPFGKFSIENSDFMPADYRLAYSFIHSNKDPLEKLLRNTEHLIKYSATDPYLQDTFIDALVHVLAYSYPVATMLVNLVESIFSDPRIGDKATIRQALAGTLGVSTDTGVSTNATPANDSVLDDEEFGVIIP